MRGIFVGKLEDIQENIEKKNDKLRVLLTTVRKSMISEGYIDTDKGVKALDEAIELIGKDSDYKLKKEEFEILEAQKRVRKEPEIVEDSGDIYGEIEVVIEWLNDPDEVNVLSFIEELKVSGDPDVYADIMEGLLYNKGTDQRLVTLPNINAESWFEKFMEETKYSQPDIEIR